MWTAVASRKHTIFKVFPFSSGSNEFMIYGTVVSGLKSGANVNIDWAARAELVKSAADGKWRMKFYQVYLVRALQHKTTTPSPHQDTDAGNT